MKKLISVALIVCLALCVISCGKSQTVPPKNVVVPVEPAPEKPVEQTMDITVYFPDNNMMYLHPETKTVIASDNIYKDVAECVIFGPAADSLNIKPIKGEVKVLSAMLDNNTGICTIDLSKEFADNNTGGTTREIMAVYSLVNSLCELDGVKSVKINIEGEINPQFGGHFSLENPFEKQESYVQK